MTPRRPDPLRRILPLVIALVGLVWLLQGLGVPIGGGFMVGDSTWAVIGAVMIAVAAVLYRKRR